MQNDWHITPEELTLLRDATTRNAAFDRVVDGVMLRLYGYARRIVVVEADAEDVTQETLVRAYNRIGSFRGGCEEFMAWLYRITTNEAIGLLRRRKRSFFTSLDDVSRELVGAVSAASDPAADELLVRFQQAVLELPLKQRLVFNLRYYDELPYARIAEILGQREATLKVNYHYAVTRLKERLKEEIL